MEGTIVSKYINEDTAEVLKVLSELARKEELWPAIKDVIIEYMRAEQGYTELVKDLAEQDVGIIQAAINNYPEILRITENALKIHSFWPFHVIQRVEKARELAHQDVESFIHLHKELQERKLTLLLEAQKERLANMRVLLQGLRELAVSLQSAEEAQLLGR
ncbi:MAG: hypothetical protein QW734_04435 [Candidatus Bathyarchaeia archaeon]